MTVATGAIVLTSMTPVIGMAVIAVIAEINHRRRAKLDGDRLTGSPGAAGVLESGGGAGAPG